LSSQLTIGVPALTGTTTGGAVILSYLLEMDQAGGGAGPWTEIAGSTTDSLELQHVISSLTPGVQYFFRYKARNQHGWSTGYSPVLATYVATAPDTTTPATLTNSGVQVTISWTAPSYDGAAPILGYRAKVKGSDGLFYEETATCSGMDGGSQQAAILSALSCSISMASLITAPFSLTEGTLIVAVVESVNMIGSSAASPENAAGALVQVVPHAPPSAPTRGSNTNGASLEVLWATYSQDGGSAILAYGLEIDLGDGAGYVPAAEVLVSSGATSATITSGISSGATYTLRYRARNVHGWSAYSPTPDLTIIAATVPSPPADPVETINNALTTAVTVSWGEPADLGGAGITISDYRVLLRESDGATFTAYTPLPG
jgi:hypothetical protein